MPAIVRKDYWVTRILRAIAAEPELRSQVIFKGGTSLSKGWRLEIEPSRRVTAFGTYPIHPSVGMMFPEPELNCGTKR